MMRLVGGRNRLKTTKENGYAAIDQFAVNVAQATLVVQVSIYVQDLFFPKARDTDDPRIHPNSHKRISKWGTLNSDHISPAWR